MQVREIIQSNLREQGIESQARPYIDSLASTIQSRIDEAVENLTDFAVSRGLSEREAQAAFVEAGLVQPVVVEATTADPTTVLARTVESLAEFARRHGWRG